MGVRPSDAPDLAGVITAANEVGLPYVVIGGFAVIANQYVRGTEDVDLLIDDDHSFDQVLARFLDRIEARRNGAPVPAGAIAQAETMRVESRFGQVDILRAGDPPVDFASVSSAAIQLTFRGHRAPVASLASLVAFKRIAGRPRDQLDLAELERIHGPLPIQPIPGLDD
ncbi:MAG TPA: hypothetical protein VHV77_17750 [Pirellulales bacterium]|jgi:hypothetical protein|nr:hypothetical protein [Pirellulales bacterium]